jgi:hypothetical protein
MAPSALNAGQLAARTVRAVAAASDAARDLGLVVSDPQILHDGFSVIVHLAPSPVVARVPVVLPPGLDSVAQRQRQSRELAVASWLDASGCPIVRPSPNAPLRPISRDGLSMTLWELVEVDAERKADWTANSALVAGLHAALVPCPYTLPFLAPIAITVPPCLTFLKSNPGLLPAEDLERALREWAALAPVLMSVEGFASRFPRASIQTIHGDAPYYNLVQTIAGPRHADFEDVTLGPPEWDLAFAGADAIRAYDAAALAAGGRRLDPDVLRVMEAARMLQLVSCFALIPQLPTLDEGLGPMRDQWRTMPFAGGLDSR